MKRDLPQGEEEERGERERVCVSMAYLRLGKDLEFGVWNLRLVLPRLAWGERRGKIALR